MYVYSSKASILCPNIRVLVSSDAISARLLIRSSARVKLRSSSLPCRRPSLFVSGKSRLEAHAQMSCK